MHRSDFRILRATWIDDSAALSAVRERVFVEEQKVPKSVVFDGRDAACDHVLALTDISRPIGTGRILPTGQIGRVAVLKPWRNCGIGTAMLSELAQLAIGKGLHAVTLHAQLPAVVFYESLGYQADGPVFMEAGIAHRNMRLSL